MSDKYVRDAMQAARGLRLVYTLYPVIGAGASAGTLLVNAAAANTFGVSTPIVALNAIATEFFYCQTSVSAASVAENFVVSIDRSAATTVFASVIHQFRVSATLVTINVGPFTPTFPVRIAPLCEVSGRVASVSGADTVTVSVLVATGL